MTDPNRNRGPRAVSPTPLRDWMERQPRRRLGAFVLLFAALIACGGKAGAQLPMAAVPATQQVLFALLAGALLGSRLGAVSATLYLLAACAASPLWPIGAGATPLTGLMAGYLWSLPLSAFLSGLFVERARSEMPVYFAIGVTAALGAFEAFGSLRLLAAQDLSASEAVARGAAFFTGQNIAQGALTVLIASQASAAIRAREKR